MGGLRAKSSITVRLCILSLQTWTETLEVELEGGATRRIQSESAAVGGLQEQRPGCLLEASWDSETLILCPFYIFLTACV